MFMQTQLKVTASRSSGEIYFLTLLCLSIHAVILCRVYQNVSRPILKYWRKKLVHPPATLRTKYETRHISLFRLKLVSPYRFSLLLIIIFSTKGFLTITTVIPFPHEIALQTGMISVVECVQYDHTLGWEWSTDASAVYASERNRPKTDAVWSLLPSFLPYLLHGAESFLRR